MSDIFTPGWKGTPYWWDGLSPVKTTGELPSSVDVVIVGAGYTGLNAAIETAAGGRTTLVLDAQTPGWGCSSRNGGQISTSIKPSLAKLTAQHGAERARAIRQEGRTALYWIEERVRDLQIDCGFTRSGRFHAAHTPEVYEALARDAETVLKNEGIEAHPVPRSEQRLELGSDSYHGGLVFPAHASLDPGRYHQGLLRAALAAGAHVVGDCPATAITKVAGGFEVRTDQGVIKVRDILIATNGYTTRLTPWLRRRIVPIGSYIIATEPLPSELMDELFPTNRIASDSCKVVYYYRASPDKKRVIFGGRVSARETDPSISGPKLQQDLCRIFPQLEPYKITHSWCGTVAYSFDEMAHIGIHDGIHFALGYCGSGVSMASYLGMRAGQKLLQNAAGKTAFDDLPFPTRPLYSGNPWFLPTVVAFYRWHDRFQYKRAARAA